MLEAVHPRSKGWSGGAYGRTSLPTAQVGDGFVTPGTPASVPPGVPSAAVKQARNNEGSNVQIPYARIVPLHQRADFKRYGTPGYACRSMVIDGVSVLEYEGLRKGTLAWVLGRRYETIPVEGIYTGNGSQMPAIPNNLNPSDPRNNSMDQLSESQRYAHQAHAGTGYGVDRMQRLASVDWIEAMFQKRAGFDRIDLHKINLVSDRMKQVCDDKTLALMAGSTATVAFDVTKSVATINSANGVTNDRVRAVANGGPQMQGVFVMELGPFLRGMQTSTEAIPLAAVRNLTAAMDAPRNMGTCFVFQAIEEEIRRRNLMDWTPDGIVLSKLESPSGEPDRSTTLDSRDGQLFNIGVHGPALTTTWTSDVRDDKLACQPLDKVFVCLVADLSWREDKSPEMKDAATRARRKNEDVRKAYEDVEREARVGGDVTLLVESAATKEKKAREAAQTMADLADQNSFPLHYDAVRRIQDNLSNLRNMDGAPIPEHRQDAFLEDLQDAQKVLDDMYDFPTTKDAMDETEVVQHDIRNGTMLVGPAYLSNFRLMRSTSSHMANCSHFVPGNKNSRCGLCISKPKEVQGPYALIAPEMEGGGEYIVGAWCIGTVIDSAASRCMVGSTVRTAPTSMELNLSVDISWWSGDRLYQHYMDVHGQVTGRGQPPVSHPIRPTEGASALNRANRDITTTDRLGIPPHPPIGASFQEDDNDAMHTLVKKNKPEGGGVDLGGLANLARSVRPRRA